MLRSAQQEFERIRYILINVKDSETGTEFFKSTINQSLDGDDYTRWHTALQKAEVCYDENQNLVIQLNKKTYTKLANILIKDFFERMQKKLLTSPIITDETVTIDKNTLANIPDEISLNAKKSNQHHNSTQVIESKITNQNGSHPKVKSKSTTTEPTPTLSEEKRKAIRSKTANLINLRTVLYDTFTQTADLKWRGHKGIEAICDIFKKSKITEFDSHATDEELLRDEEIVTKVSNILFGISNNTYLAKIFSGERKLTPEEDPVYTPRTTCEKSKVDKNTLKQHTEVKENLSIKQIIAKTKAFLADAVKFEINKMLTEEKSKTTTDPHRSEKILIIKGFQCELDDCKEDAQQLKSLLLKMKENTLMSQKASTILILNIRLAKDVKAKIGELLSNLCENLLKQNVFKNVSASLKQKT